MTTNESAAPVSTVSAIRLRAAAARLGARVAFSEVTPVVASAVALLSILTVAGGVLLTHRLEEIAAQRKTPSVVLTAAQQTTQQQQALDFTLSPDEVRPISEDEARAFNAGLPFSTLPILSAKPFLLPADRLEDYSRALDCLATAVYYEAASETAEGQAAVAQVVLNRVRHPAYPKSVCGVVFQGSERQTGCQFSFTCDGALGRTPSVAGWARARAVAASALNGSVASGVGMATHYHTDWVAPYWAERLVKMRQIGTHIFYRWAGTWGLPGAFTGRYADAEPVIEKMGGLATPVEALDTVTSLPTTVGPLESLVVAMPAPIIVAEPVAQEEEAAPAAAPVVVAPPPVSTAAANPLNQTRTGEPPRRRARIATPF